MQETTTTRMPEMPTKPESFYKNRGIQLFWLLVALVDAFLMLDFAGTPHPV